MNCTVPKAKTSSVSINSQTTVYTVEVLRTQREFLIFHSCIPHIISTGKGSSEHRYTVMFERLHQSGVSMVSFAVKVSSKRGTLSGCCTSNHLISLCPFKASNTITKPTDLIILSI